jgi:hypothetical protein
MAASVRLFNLEGVFDEGQARPDFVASGLSFGRYVVCAGPTVPRALLEEMAADLE